MLGLFNFMQTQAYKDYLKSTEWKYIKLDIIQLRGNRCEKCKEQRQVNILHLHHKTYVRLFNEKLTDLELLYPKCHMKEHGIKEKNGKRIIKKVVKKPKPKLPKQLRGKHNKTELDFIIYAKQAAIKKNLPGKKLKNGKTRVQVVEERIKRGYYKTEHSKLNAMTIVFKRDNNFN
jgi:hypothetical protein